jgi:hypothetical protein
VIYCSTKLVRYEALNVLEKKRREEKKSSRPTLRYHLTLSLKIRVKP